MKQKRYDDEVHDSDLDSKKIKQNEDLIKEVESLNLDVPDEIMQRIESDVEKSEKQPKISMGIRVGCSFPLFLPASENSLVFPLICSVLSLPGG